MSPISSSFWANAWPTLFACDSPFIWLMANSIQSVIVAGPELIMAAVASESDWPSHCANRMAL